MTSRKMNVLGWRTSMLACASVALLATGSAARAATSTWTPDATAADVNGNWTDLYQVGIQAGWASSVPNAEDDIAALVSSSTLPVALNLNVNANIGSLTATNRVGPTISTSNGSTITMDTSGGSAVISHSGRNSLILNVDIILLNTNLNVSRTGGESAARVIDFNNSITGTGNIVIAVSGRGLVSLDGDVNNVGSLTIDNSASNAGDISVVNGNIGSNVVSVVKNGAVTVSLTGTNNAYGDTIVNAGILNVTNSLGSGEVSIAGAAVLQLGSSINQFVDSIILGGVLQTAAGTYGSVTSAADFKSEYFAGTGVIQLAVPEPATLALMGMGGLMIATRRRQN